MRRLLFEYRDSATTWPSLTIKLRLLPWHWRLIPRGWYDYAPGDEESAGRWAADAEWLFAEVTLSFNIPAFIWERSSGGAS